MTKFKDGQIKKKKMTVCMVFGNMLEAFLLLLFMMGISELMNG
jgi:hypothetical protein